MTENFQLTASTISQEGIITGTVTTGTTPLSGATVKVFDTNLKPLCHTDFQFADKEYLFSASTNCNII